MSFWRKLLIDESGPTAVEYAVMLALILMSVITAVSPPLIKGLVKYSLPTYKSTVGVMDI